VICSEQVKLLPEIVAGEPLHITVARPESPSLTNPLTATLIEGLIPPSGGEVMLTRGGVRSRFTVALALAVLPTASTAVPLIT